SPGLRFFHQGQFEGRQKRISPHLGRAPDEPVNPTLRPFYERLLNILQQPVLRNGQWRLLECAPPWDGNWINDGFIACSWQGSNNERLLVAVNYAPNQSQCQLKLPFGDLAGKTWRLVDQLSNAAYDRTGIELQSQGLYLDHAPWQACV